jgi:hypothetical protein
MVYQNTTFDLMERCKSTRYPVIKLGLHEDGPFRRVNLGQEHDDLLYDLRSRAIEMWIHEDAAAENDDARTIYTLCTLQKSLIDYSLYTVLLKYKDKDGEDCVIFDGMEVIDAINEHQGSSSFKIIAKVREKGREPNIGSIDINLRRQDIVNDVERREESDSDRTDTRSLLDMVESRDDCTSNSHPLKGDVSVLTEQSSRKISSLLTKSIFGLIRRKQRQSSNEVKGDASMSSADEEDDDHSTLSSPPVISKSMRVILIDDGTGIGASYTETLNTPSSPESSRLEWMHPFLMFSANT